VSRVFLSHSSLDSREATAVKAWLIEHEPGLAEEIFLDLDPHTGILPGCAGGRHCSGLTAAVRR